MGSAKNQYPNTYNWQSTSPVIGFLPNPYPQGSKPSGTVTGTMSGTNTIYSNIMDVSKMDTLGLEVTWTGTPTGVFQVMVSNSGITFNALTFDPVLAQPAGAAGSYYVNIATSGFKYIMLQYANATGTGVLTVYGQNKASS